MKVIHICQRDDPSTGGALRVAVELTKRLPKYQIESQLLFLYGDQGYFGSHLDNVCHYLKIENSRDIFRLPRLIAYLKKEAPNCVHHHDELLWPQLLTFHHPSFKKVVHIHSQPLSVSKNYFKTRIIQACQRYSADALVCLTESWRQIYLNQFKFSSKVLHTIHNGVDFGYYQPYSEAEKDSSRKLFNLPADKAIIGFVGRLHNRMKGVDDFLRVIAQLPANFWGLVVGTGQDLEKLQEQTQQLNISERVRFTGWLNEPIQAYQAMDIFCFTSRYEPFGLTIAEAMACEVPVIGFSCVGGSQEILTSETGTVIDNRNIVQMVDAIISTYYALADDQPKVNAARRLIETQYNWELTTDKLVQIYDLITKE